MAKISEARTTRLTGIAALEHAARTGVPIRRRWSLLSLGGEVDLEDAFRIARDSSPDELYAEVIEDLESSVEALEAANDDLAAMLEEEA